MPRLRCARHHAPRTIRLIAHLALSGRRPLDDGLTGDPGAAGHRPGHLARWRTPLAVAARAARSAVRSQPAISRTPSTSNEAVDAISPTASPSGDIGRVWPMRCPTRSDMPNHPGRGDSQCQCVAIQSCYQPARDQNARQGASSARRSPPAHRRPAPVQGGLDRCALVSPLVAHSVEQ